MRRVKRALAVFGTSLHVLYALCAIAALVYVLARGFAVEDVHAAPRGRMDLVSVDGLPSGTYFTVIRDAITNKEYLVASFRGSSAIAVCPMGNAPPAEKGQPE